MRYALIDKDNNIIHMLDHTGPPPSEEVLNQEFQQFQEKVQDQGLLSLCVGSVHLVSLTDCYIRLHRQKDGNWEARYA